MLRNNKPSHPNHLLNPAKELGDNGALTVVYQRICAYVSAFNALIQCGLACSWIEGWWIYTIRSPVCDQSAPELIGWKCRSVGPSSIR